MSSQVWINGQRHAPDALHVSARDRGFTLADGVFETMRVHGSVVFRLGRHLARLRHGLEVLALPPVTDLERWVHDAARGTPYAHASLRLTVTRGSGSQGLRPSDTVSPTVVIVTDSFPEFSDAIYSEGLRAHVAAGRRNEHAMTAGLKTIAYTDAVIALIEARRAGAGEAIFLDTAGHCSEATGSNLFIRAGDTLMTPPVSCAALPGITRATVMELAGDLGWRTVEEAFDERALREADEAFLTSSLRGIAPLVQIGDQRIGAGAPGEWTRRIAAAYRARVIAECRSAPSRR